MRQITRDSVNAFLAGRKFNGQNMSVVTAVLSGGPTTSMYLHGNLIAEMTGVPAECNIRLTDAGWESNTTKERLNGVLDLLDLWRDKIWSINGRWHYADDILWLGDARIEIRDSIAELVA